MSFRNSKLTALVSDTLAGNCNTAFIATINPEEEFGLESISTCKFVHGCSLVKQDERTTNETEDLPSAVERLQRENGALRDQLDGRHRAQGGDANGRDKVPSPTDHTQSGQNRESPDECRRLVQRLASVATAGGNVEKFLDEEVTNLEFAKQCLALLAQEQRPTLQQRAGPYFSPVLAASKLPKSYVPHPEQPPTPSQHPHQPLPRSYPRSPTPGRDQRRRFSPARSPPKSPELRRATDEYHKAVLLTAQQRMQQQRDAQQDSSNPHSERAAQPSISLDAAPETVSPDAAATNASVADDSMMSVSEVLRAGQVYVLAMVPASMTRHCP